MKSQCLLQSSQQFENIRLCLYSSLLRTEVAYIGTYLSAFQRILMHPSSR